jgi:hypothetical protein
MRADEVRATFKTDSPELRAALSQEWNASQPSGAERSMRLAPPSFTSTDGAGTGGFAGHGSSRQHDPSARGNAEPFSLVTPRSRGARTGNLAAAAPVAAGPARIPHRTSRHLHTLA